VPEIWDAVDNFEPFLSFFLHHGPRDGVCVDVLKELVGVCKSFVAKGALHFFAMWVFLYPCIYMCIYMFVVTLLYCFTISSSDKFLFMYFRSASTPFKKSCSNFLLLFCFLSGVSVQPIRVI